MVIDLKKAAEMLGTPEATLLRWARQGKVPARERGTTFVFVEDELARWARRRHLPVYETVGATGDGRMEPSLYEAMRRGGIHAGVGGNDVRGVLEAACRVIPLPDGLDRAALLDRLIQREALSSTGIGNGVAIPHPRHPIDGTPGGGVIGTCYLEHEVDFGAIDGMPVFVLFVMLSPDTRSHLRLLSRLSYCLRSDEFVAFLRERRGGDDVFAEVREIEARFARDET